MKQGTIQFTLCALLCLSVFSVLEAQSNPDRVAFDPARDAQGLQAMVEEDFIANDCFEVFNITLNQGLLGSNASIGTFRNGQKALGMDNGLFLANAPIGNFSGGNSITSAGGLMPGASGNDPDLQIINVVYGDGLPITINESTTLEFDFIPTAESVSFTYVWASEEYCDFVNTQFNDKFGLFLEGPNINGPFTGQKINLAEIPDEFTGEPTNVSINNIHDFRNSIYYVDNTTDVQRNSGGGTCNSIITPLNPNANLIQFDGYTVPLQARFDNLEICQTYHMKIIVADGSDRIFGSGIFLQGKSFNAAQGAGVTNITFNDTGETYTYETCGDSIANIEFTREFIEGTDNNADIIMPIDLINGSSATYGLDYTTGLPPIGDIRLPAGGLFEQIVVHADDFDEGTETINISIQNPCFCEPEVFTLEIIDVPPIEVRPLVGDTSCIGVPRDLRAIVEGGGFPSVDRAVPPAEFEYIWSDTSGVISMEEIVSVDLSDQGTYTYFLEVFDGCGGIHRDTVTFVTNGIPDAELVGDYSICDESPTATLDFELEGGVPVTLEYTLDGNPQTPLVITDPDFEFVVSEIGEYQLTRIDGVNCGRDITGIAVVSNQSFELDVVPTPTLCSDSEDGMLMAIVSAGMGDYTYLWNDADAQETEMATGLVPGDYIVIVTDELGCTQEFMQTVPAAAEVNVVPSLVSGTTCADPASGSASAVGDGGAGGFTFTWFDGGGMQVGTGETIDGLPSGDYDVEITDDNGCQTMASINIPSDIAAPDAMAGDAIIDCNNMMASINTSGTSTGPEFTYTWTVNSGGGSIQTDPVDPIATTSDPGSYTLTVTNSENGCTSTAVFEVIDNTEIIVSDPGETAQINCNVDAITLGGPNTSTGNDFTYDWSIVLDDSSTSTDSGQNITATAAGTYTLLVTNNENGCTAMETVIITDDLADPVVSIDPAGAITCVDETQLLTAGSSSSGGDFTYTWTTLDGSFVSDINDETATVNNPGTYMLTIVNNANGCEASNTIVVLEDADRPMVSIVQPNNIDCINTQATLDGSGSDSGPGIEYTWTNEAGDVVGNDPILMVDTEGVYTLEVNNTMTGCSRTDAETVVDITEDPVADPGQPAQIDCNVSEIALGGPNTSTGGNFSYDWTIAVDGGGTSNQSSQNIMATAAGTYTLLVTNTDNGCTATNEVVITDDLEDPTVNIDTPELLTCEDDTQVLTASGSSSAGNFTYTWTTTDGSIITDANAQTVSIDDPGTYMLTILNNDNGCEDFTTIVVEEDAVFPNVSIVQPENIDCSATQVLLDGSGSDSGAGIEYTWTNDQNEIVGTDASILVDEPGEYTLEVNNTLTGCTERERQTVVDIREDPVADPGPIQNLNCDVTEISLGGDNISTGAEFTYEWTQLGVGVISSSANPEINEGGEYTLVVTNTTNNCSATQTIMIPQNTENPDINVDVSGIITCQDPIQTLMSDGSSTGGEFEYLWTGPDGFTSTEQNPDVDLFGDYTLVITNTTNRCSVSESFTVEEDAEFPAIEIVDPAVVNCENMIIELSGLGSEVGNDIVYEWIASNGGVIEDDADSLNPEISAAGTYSLTVSNTVTGCSRTLEVEVTDDFEAPTAMVNENLTFGCQDDVLQITGAGSSTGANITYEWSATQGNISGDRDVLDTEIDQPGNYTLLVTNTENGCTNEASFVVVPDEALPEVVVVQPLALTCDRDLVLIDASASDAGANLEYVWTKDDVPFTPANQGSFEVDEPGEYTLTITDSDNGCVSAGTTIVDQMIELPIAEAGELITLNCRDMMLNLDADGSSDGADFTYDWTAMDGGNIVSGEDTDEPLVDEPGMYLLTVTNTLTGCQNTDEVQVMRNDTEPVIQVADISTLNCRDEVIMLDASASDGGSDFEISWEAMGMANIDSGDDTLTPSVDEPGTYVLTIVDTRNFCETTMEVVVEQNIEDPEIGIFPAELLTCRDQTVELLGSAGGTSTGAEFTYTWTNPSATGSFAGATDGIDVIVDEPGTYELLVVNTENFCERSIAIVVDQNVDAPEAMTGNAQEVTCENLEATLSGAGSSTGTEFEYSWTPIGSGVIVSGETSLTPVVNAPGDYELTVLNTNNGCTTTSIQSVTSNDVFPQEAPPAALLLTCGLTEQVLAGSGNPGLTYEWTTNNGNIVGATTGSEITIDEPGIYVMTITDVTNGCSTPYQIPVEQNIEDPTVDAGPTSQLTCTETVVALLGAGSDGPNFTYEWTTTDGTLSGDTDELEAFATASGTYTLTIINNVNDCISTDDVFITVDEDVPTGIDVEALSPACFGDLGGIDFMGIDGGVGPFDYSIDGGETFTDDTLFPNLTPGQTYSLLISDSNGCTLEQQLAIPTVDSLSIQVAEPFVELQLGESFDILTFVTIPEDEIASITWTPSTGLSCDDCLDPDVSPFNSITYNVVVVSEGGCIDEANIEFRVDRNIDIYVPNAFSPGNLDGINDMFAPLGKADLDATVRQFQIFDRWGEKVYEDGDFEINAPGRGWDGGFRDDGLQTGVFVYYILLEFVDGSTELLEGDVTLMD